MIEYKDFHWKNGRKLYLGKKYHGKVNTIDEVMFWIEWPGGKIKSAWDYNLTRAKDNFIKYTMLQLNRELLNPPSPKTVPREPLGRLSSALKL
jgi:hypothetical protein